MTAAATHAAIKSHIEDLTFSPAIPIAWQNKDFVPDGNRFLKVTIIPAPVQRLGVAVMHRRAGSVAITVASRVNNGSGEGDGLADAVAAHFPADLKLTAGTKRLRITADPSIRDGFREAGYWHTPVVIPFEVLD